MKISICIPSYNRVEFLCPLLDSIRNQSQQADEVIICEDVSPQRNEIIHLVEQYKIQFPDFPLTLYLNEENLGYDGNFRQLLERASGEYCLFMGNDDLLKPKAVERVLKVTSSHTDVAVISRAYSWFYQDKDNIKETVKHLDGDTLFEPGVDSVRFFYRRMGVLSGLVFKREPCLKISTSKYDGHLYYQMYLAGSLLQEAQGYYISDVQTLSRDGINPDFGNAKKEKEKFKPGSFGYKGRVYMVKGLLDIARDLDKDKSNPFIFRAIKEDIGNYFYPYVRDQFNLPIKQYFSMYKELLEIGMNGNNMFHLYMILGYLIKKDGMDSVIKIIRKLLGRSPKFGF